MLMLLAPLVVTNAAALAGDFALVYAIDANGKRDSGKLEGCSYEQQCEIHAAGLIIGVLVHSRATGLPTLQMSVLSPSGHGLGTGDQFQSTLTPDLLRVPIYRQVMKGRDEFVRNSVLMNERIGTVYLNFSPSR
jgi:hypothetical protein